MTAAPILETLRRHGVTVRREGNRLKLKPATGNVPADVVELARAHKAELLAALPDSPDLRATLRRLAAAEELPRALVDRLTDADLHPDNGVGLLSEAGLRRWLHVIEEARGMEQGRVPRDWTQPASCRRCGPVLLWPGAPAHVLGCPWCRIRRMGLALPRPDSHPTTDHGRN